MITRVCDSCFALVNTECHYAIIIHTFLLFKLAHTIKEQKLSIIYNIEVSFYTNIYYFISNFFKSFLN